MRILIAEDDPVSRLVLATALRKLGHDALQANDGARAWEILSQEQIPVLITDWMMPGMAGPELCRRLREQNRSRYTYIIILTVMDSRENFLEGMQAGADDYLTKPLDVEELTARLRVAERVISLQHEVRQLKEFLSVCSYCRKIRLDDDSWASLEKYLGQHTTLSHGMCPDCYASEIRPELDRLPR